MSDDERLHIGMPDFFERYTKLPPEKQMPLGMGHYADPKKIPAPEMTLRDYFAGQALIGIVTTPEFQGFGAIATVAYEIADAMLEARTKPAA